MRGHVAEQVRVQLLIVMGGVGHIGDVARPHRGRLAGHEPFALAERAELVSIRMDFSLFRYPENARTYELGRI